MKLRGFLALIAAILICLTTACTSLPPDLQSEPSPATTIQRPHSPVPEPSPLSNSSQSSPTLPPQPEPTLLPTITKGSYLINQYTTSTRTELKHINLILYYATLTDEHLILHIGLRNNSDESAYVSAGFKGSDLRLVDAAGNEYEPVDLSANLQHLGPLKGFIPGQANVGDVVFPLPQGSQPYELHLPLYEPLRFTLQQPMSLTVQPVAEGTYPLSLDLYSSNRALVPIILRLDSVTLTDDEVIFSLAFVNTQQKAYYLGKGLAGYDARLLDAEFAAYEPLRVSDNLIERIDPPNGWLPNQAHAGEIVFPRPQQIGELKFIFPLYAAATLRFAESGMISAAVTSASRDTPPPTVTPTPKQVVLRELESLLERQAGALITGDMNAYLATFTADLHQEQQTIFTRSRQMPLANYQLTISPSTVLIDDEIERGRIENIAVNMRYQLRDTPTDNPFLFTLRYSFERRDGSWVVSKYDLDGTPPFWWTDDIIVQETPHFLVVSRPGAESTLATVAQECEQAYRDLQGAGLKLEERFVVYFTMEQDDFTTQTGLGSRTLGAALSFYELSGEQLQTVGRAFYINGAAFTEQSEQSDPLERLVTIRHELVHLALARETRPFTPIWLVEGAAVYFANQLTPDVRRRLVEDGKLDSLSLEQLTGEESLGSYDLLGQNVAYEYVFSGETVRYLIDTYGSDSFWEFYRYFSNIPTDRFTDQLPLFSIGFGAPFGKISQELTPEALREVYGITVTDLDTAVKQRLREQ